MLPGQYSCGHSDPVTQPAFVSAVHVPGTTKLNPWTCLEDKHEVGDTVNVLGEEVSRKLVLASQAGTAWDTLPGA